MRKNIVIESLLLLSFALFGCSKNAADAPDTNPDIDKYAELVSACSEWKAGGGISATGGQGTTTVYHITTLEDGSKVDLTPGTLRYALMQTGKRIIVFDVSGTIELCAPLSIKNVHQGDLSILGQSAPGQGICLANYPLELNNTQNVVIRFLRFRLGNKSLESSDDDYDAISINNSRNIMVDHCSASWSVDECVSCYGNENFTLQYCFITESLRNAGHPKGAHGYGGIWGGKNASFHHNLLAHHDSRNPRFDHDYVTKTNVTPMDFINNVVYDWGGNSAYGGEGSSNTGNQRQYNFINNYFKPGPSTNDKVKSRLLNPTTSCDQEDKKTKEHQGCIPSYGGTVVPGKFYVTGNIMESSTGVTNDNWSGVHPDESSKKDDCKSSYRFSFTGAYTQEQTAQEAYETVLAKAGCSLSRDAVDKRIVDEVKKGTGKLIDKPSDVGGWPELSGDEVIEDTDGDGIPDEWETKYGLNPNDRKDARLKSLVTGYTNYEVYLNAKVAHLY